MTIFGNGADTWRDLDPVLGRGESIWSTTTQRFSRVFIGAAIPNGSGAPVTTPNWMENAFPTAIQNSHLAVGSTVGLIAATFAARTSDFVTMSGNTAGSHGTIGSMNIVDNDDAVFDSGGWAGYDHARRRVGAGGTWGREISVENFGNVVPLTPFNIVQSGMTVNAWLTSGIGQSGTNAVSAALGLANNPSRFDKGIVFGAQSLTGTDGVSGAAIAIEMAPCQKLVWRAADNSTCELWREGGKIKIKDSNGTRNL